MSVNPESPKHQMGVSPSRLKDGRRRLLGAGSALTVLASLKSGSALAAGVCVGPSAFTSIRLNPATSNKPRDLLTCHSHGYWKNAAWPISRDTKVKGVFSLCGLTTTIGITDTTKLIDVLNMGGDSFGEDRAFARDLICAYLDAMSNGANSPFTTMDIQKMWSLVFCGGSFSVNGTPWTRQTVRGFLDVLVGTSPL